jgi:predicted acylesterase/phospholipase RssA
MFAQTPTLEGVARLANAWKTTNPASVLLGREPPTGRPPQALAGLLMFSAARRVTGGQPSLYSDSGLKQLLEQYLGTPRFEELALPLYVIAANLNHADRAIFSRGPVMPAILASSAIPGIFPPVRIGEEIYVDGGALDNCSLDTALRAGARRLFVVDVGFNGGAEKPLQAADLFPQGGRLTRRATSLPVGVVLERTSQAMNRYHLERALERVPRGVETHVMRLSTHARGSSMGFGAAEEWIEEGYEQACAYLRRALPVKRRVFASAGIAGDGGE